MLVYSTCAPLVCGLLGNSTRCNSIWKLFLPCKGADLEVEIEVSPEDDPGAFLREWNDAAAKQVGKAGEVSNLLSQLETQDQLAGHIRAGAQFLDTGATVDLLDVFCRRLGPWILVYV